MSIFWLVVDVLTLVIACWVGLRVSQSGRGAPAETPGQVNGADCWVTAKWHDEYKQSVSVSVSFPCPRTPEFVFSREWWFDRWSKALGLSVEFQTCDERFDNTIYILCDDPAVHRWLKKDGDSRADLVELLLLKPLAKGEVTAIRCNGDVLTVQARVSASGFSKDEAVAKIGQAVSEACAPRAQLVADRLSRASAQTYSASGRRDRYATQSRALVGAAAGFFIASLIIMMLPSWQTISFNPDDPMTRLTITASLAIVLLTVVVTLLMLWGSSRTHGTLVIVVGLVLFGLLMSASRLMTHLNQGLDSSIPREYLATIQSHHPGHGKFRSACVTVNGIVTHPGVELEVNHTIYELSDGSTLRLFERHGFFGVPWISAL